MIQTLNTKRRVSFCTFAMITIVLSGCENEPASPKIPPVVEESQSQPAAAVAVEEVTTAHEPQSTDWRRVTSNDETYDVEWRVVDHDDVPVNERFALEVRALNRDDELLATDKFDLLVDAAMPHHGHGMNRLPIVEQSMSGTWIAKGMLFHMPGRWELYFDVENDGVIERAQAEVMLD